MQRPTKSSTKVTRAGKAPSVRKPPRERATPPARRDAGRPRGEPVADAVLDCTLAELAASGVAGLSVDRIARAAEVNKTSVYRRWPTREALIAAALERVLDDLTMEQTDTGSLRGDLLAMGESVAQLLAQPMGRALTQAVFAQESAPSIAALARRKLAQSASGPAAAMVMRAQHRGEWRHDADPVVVLGMLVGAILHRIMLERAEPGRRWLQDVVDMLARSVHA